MNMAKEPELMDRSKYDPDDSAHLDYLDDIIREAHRTNQSGTPSEKMATLCRIFSALLWMRPLQ